jgi:hypothetical protein
MLGFTPTLGQVRVATHWQHINITPSTFDDEAICFRLYESFFKWFFVSMESKMIERQMQVLHG